MSTEAFLWTYRNGEPIGFEYEAVLEILSTDDMEWNEEHGLLRLTFHEPPDSVDIFLDMDAKQTNHTRGIMVSRPISHPDFLERIFRLMQSGNVMLFSSDETTPVFVRGANTKHYPPDLLKELGEPRFVESPSELVSRT
jgi:hypothetical protein